MKGEHYDKGLYVVGTDTDIGKTYVTALLIKTLRQGGYDVAYYKPAISGAKRWPHLMQAM